MVQANELRINNWYVLGSQYFQLTEKGFQDVIVFNTVDRLFPIPLTSGLLEKCGFVKDRSGFALPNKMSLSFSVTKELGYMACWEDKSLHLPYDIQYLHQLQNLYFALTGEELAVNL